MSSLKQHLERTKAKKQAAAVGVDPRLSAKKKKATAALPFLTQAKAQGKEAGNEQNGNQNSDHNNQGGNPDGNAPLELKFFNDWEQLSNIKSHEKKTELKAELLPSYLPWIEGTLAGGIATGQADQNDMLLKLMVWCLDTQDFATATDIAQFAMLNDMVMPEPFSRSVATVYAEQVAEEVIKNTPDNLASLADTLAQAVDITNDADMPDPVRAKLYRAWGNSLRDNHPADAITAYERAIKLDSGAGCKQDLNALVKEYQQ